MYGSRCFETQPNPNLSFYGPTQTKPETRFGFQSVKLNPARMDLTEFWKPDHDRFWFVFQAAHISLNLNSVELVELKYQIKYQFCKTNYVSLMLMENINISFCQTTQKMAIEYFHPKQTTCNRPYSFCTQRYTFLLHILAHKVQLIFSNQFLRIFCLDRVCLPCLHCRCQPGTTIFICALVTLTNKTSLNTISPSHFHSIFATFFST